MADIKEGQTATNPKTGQKVVFKGGSWQPMTGPVGSPVPRKLSPTEQKALVAQQEGAAAGLEAKKRTQEILPALNRLKGGAFRGRFLDAAIPEEGGGFWDTLGSIAIGGPARLVGAISGQDVKDYQAVRRAATLSTRQSETGEKGVQTEGDAARSMLSTVTPSTADPRAFAQDIIGKADRQIGRAAFYTRWANQYGLTGTDPNGRSVEQAFQATLGGSAPATRKGPTITRIK